MGIKCLVIESEEKVRYLCAHGADAPLFETIDKSSLKDVKEVDIDDPNAIFYATKCLKQNEISFLHNSKDKALEQVEKFTRLFNEGKFTDPGYKGNGKYKAVGLAIIETGK